jgi:thiosulfate/3-mercaptopyruvate sulfurtransferase
MTPSLAQIKQLVERLQINQNTWVVALDDEGGGWAGRFLWTLEMVGFQRWSLLNGGLWAWSGDGHALAQPATHTSAGPDRPKPAEEQLPGAAAWPCQWAEAQPTVDAQTLLKHLADPQWVIWDARSAAEYAGDRQSALRNGHIPGAQHYEWTQAMDKERHLRLRDPDTLRQELAERGITGDKTIVTHCHSHHRSGYTWVLGRLLGFDNIKAYPGSWGEWGNSADLPVVTGEAPQRPAE